MHKFKSRSTKNVIGLKLSGTLTREEYQDIVPYLKEKIEEYGKIRLLIELDHWEGWGPYAAFDDIIFVFKNSTKLERVAFWVKSRSDKRAVLIDQPFSPWFKDRTRYFGPEEKEEAWKWVSAGIKGIELPSEEDEDSKKERGKKVRYGPKMNVLIIGGGIAGMTAAALLQQKGFEPRLVEAHKELMDNDRMLYLWPTAAGVLKSLKLYKKVLKASAEVASYSLYDAEGNALQTYDNKEIQEEYGPILVIPRGKLIKILSKAILPNVLRRGVAATKLKETKDGVKVTFSDGTKGVYDSVICADGLHSKMRDVVFGEHKVRYAGMVGWEFSVKGEGIKLPQEVVGYRGQDSAARLVRLGDRIYCYAAVRAEEKPVGGKQIDLLKESFKDYPEPMKQVLRLAKATDSMWHAGFYDNKTLKRVHGRVAFLGKSAYSFLPSSFLSDSIALEAALVLSEKLSCSDSNLVASSLRLYERYRNRRTKGIEEHTKKEGFQTLTHSESFMKVKDFRKEIISSESYQVFWKWFLEESF